MATKTGTTNGHWEKTTYDGLGRVIKVETGDGGGTKTIVETEYAGCACSPLGKVKKVSQPYAPGGTVYWTVYNYDGLGRVTSVQLPGNTGTTSYVYEGNTVKVTDAAGKWKKYVTDVFGNLTQVAEPQPGGGSDYLTNYTYNLANQLTQVSMTRGTATQTRTFTYDTQQRLVTAANPETGTVTYSYNGDNTVASKVDAKNQRVEYSYDAYQRVTQVRRYAVNGGAEDTCQRVNFAYDANPYDGSYTVNSLGRLSAAQWGHETACAVGRFTEMYSYTAAGLVTKKRLRLGRLNYSLAATNADLDAVYGYNNEGRMTSITQPGYYTPGPYRDNGAAYTLGYDTMGRLNTLTQTAPGVQAVISGITYGGGNQITQVSYGTGQVQTRTYNERLQMTRMTVAGVMDLEYVYSGSANNGQIVSMKNYLSGEEVIYQYDTLKRLTSALTTGPEWGQSFGYDGFGNLLSKSVVKGTAPVMSIAVDGTTNRVVGWGYDANGNVTYLPGSFTSMGYDVENRLVAANLWSGGAEQYGYGPDNKRVWRVKATGGTEVYFYGVNGERQGTYSWGVIDNNTGNIGFYLVGLESVAPKGLQVNRERLGSVMVSGTTRYYPYGEEAPVTGDDRDKYGTYRRDGGTGLDYAEQRYYASGVGRFLTADPSLPSNAKVLPGNWNRYAYVGGDPINRRDPKGLCSPEDDPPCYRTEVIETGETTGGGPPIGSACGASGERECEIESAGTEPIYIEGAAGGIITVTGVNRTGPNQDMIIAAVLSVGAFIDLDYNCKDWLQTGTFQDVHQFISQLLTAGGEQGGQSLIGHGTLNTTVPNALVNAITGPTTPGFNIVINDNGAFFNKTIGVRGGAVPTTTNNGKINGGSIEARFFILLHEFAHANGIPGFKPDANDENAGRTNNQQIEKNCGRLLKMFR